VIQTTPTNKDRINQQHERQHKERNHGKIKIIKNENRANRKARKKYKHRTQNERKSSRKHKQPNRQTHQNHMLPGLLLVWPSWLVLVRFALLYAF
jgi:hypothetical protein